MSGQPGSEIGLVLNASPGHLQGWFSAQALVIPGGVTAFASVQSMQSAAALVSAVDPLVHRYALLAEAMLPDSSRASIEALLHIELAGVIGSAWFGSSGSYSADVGLGLTARFRILISEIAGLGSVDLHVAAMHPERQGIWIPFSPTAVSYVAVASLDRLKTERGDNEQLYRLERIQSVFGLRSGEMTQLLDVSREGLRKWQSGSPMAPERSTRIDELFNLATWFESHVRPDAIPAFIRRPIPALDGDTPLDWLRGRRWRELRSVYERIFSLEISR